MFKRESYKHRTRFSHINFISCKTWFDTEVLVLHSLMAHCAELKVTSILKLKLPSPLVPSRIKYNARTYFFFFFFGRDKCISTLYTVQVEIQEKTLYKSFCFMNSCKLRMFCTNDIVEKKKFFLFFLKTALYETGIEFQEERGREE